MDGTPGLVLIAVSSYFDPEPQAVGARPLGSMGSGQTTKMSVGRRNQLFRHRDRTPWDGGARGLLLILDALLTTSRADFSSFPCDTYQLAPVINKGTCLNLPLSRELDLQ